MPTITVKITQTDLDRVDAEKGRLGKMNRSEVVRQILHEYLTEIYEKSQRKQTLEQAFERSGAY